MYYKYWWENSSHPVSYVRSLFVNRSTWIKISLCTENKSITSWIADSNPCQFCDHKLTLGKVTMATKMTHLMLSKLWLTPRFCYNYHINTKISISYLLFFFYSPDWKIGGLFFRPVHLLVCVCENLNFVSNFRPMQGKVFIFGVHMCQALKTT